MTIVFFHTAQIQARDPVARLSLCTCVQAQTNSGGRSFEGGASNVLAQYPITVTTHIVRWPWSPLCCAAALRPSILTSTPTASPFLPSIELRARLISCENTPCTLLFIQQWVFSQGISTDEERIEVVLIFYPNYGSHIVVIMPAVSTRAPPGHTATHCNPVIGNVKNMQCVITFYISGKSLLWVCVALSRGTCSSLSDARTCSCLLVRVHALSLSLSHVLSRFLSFSRPRVLSRSCSLSLHFSLSLSRALSFSSCHSRSLFLSRSIMLSFASSLPLAPSLALSHTLTRHTPAYTHTHYCFCVDIVIQNVETQQRTKVSHSSGVVTHAHWDTATATDKSMAK